jgi:citrate lyase beta subunit
MFCTKGQNMSESVVIALIGVAGAAIGSLATIAANVVMHCLSEKAASKKEKPAKDLLIEMLNHKDYEWRKLETLMHVVGADEEKTKRLLLEVGARASEDGQSLWALKSRAPLVNETNI